jgi:DNA-binding NarL/FixJ family response regulator
VRVVIGEDEALLREGLSLVLGRGGFEVVAIAADAPALEEAVSADAPDLVITDIRMPPDNTDDGLRAALRLRSAQPGLAVVVLSQHVQRQYAVELLAGGAQGIGYLLKQRITDIEGFLGDLGRVVAGGTVLDPEVVAVMVERARRTDSAVETLTPRQRDVLALVAEGRSNAAIARRLGITEKTVVQHTSLIYDQLGLVDSDDHHRRVLAVVHYLTR